MEDFLKFRKMITPAIIQILFWIGVVLCIIGGLYVMVASVFGSGNIMTFFGGLLFLVIGPVGVRIYCELLILFFRMNETLTEIKNGLASKK